MTNLYSKRNAFWNSSIFAPSNMRPLGRSTSIIKPVWNWQKRTFEATRRCTLHFRKFDYGLRWGRHFCKYRCLKMITCNAPTSSKMCSAPSAIIKIMKRELETRRCSKTCVFAISHTGFVMFFDCPKWHILEASKSTKFTRHYAQRQMVNAFYFRELRPLINSNMHKCTAAAGRALFYP